MLSSTNGLTGSYDSGYSSSYGSSYDSSYSSYGSTYSSYGTTSTIGSTTIDPNTGYAVTNSASPTSAAGVTNTSAPAAPPVLSAFVKDTKQQGILGLGGLLADVEITNPTNRALSGVLHVTFTHGGSPDGNAQSQRVTLQPMQTTVMTFSTTAVDANDAQATIDTDGLAPSDSAVTGSSVVDLQ